MGSIIASWEDAMNLTETEIMELSLVRWIIRAGRCRSRNTYAKQIGHQLCEDE